MKIGTLVRYKNSTTENLGIIVDVDRDYDDNSPVYKIQWLNVHPFVKHLIFLHPDSLVKVS